MRLIDADKLLELMKDQKEREIGAYAKGVNAGLNIVKSIINDEHKLRPPLMWIRLSIKWKKINSLTARLYYQVCIRDIMLD